MPSLQGRLLKTYLRWQRFRRRSDGPLNVHVERAELEAMTAQFKMVDGVTVDSVTANGVPAEWVTPLEPLASRVILFLFGGSYNVGSIRSHRPLVANLALMVQAPTLMIEYRQAPEHPFPAAVEDAVTAYRWLLENGSPSGRISVVGISAGGGLALSLLLSLRDANLPLPAAAVCLSPWTDLAITGESWATNAKREIVLEPDKLRQFAQWYLGEADPRTPLASPLYASFEGLSPLLIQAAGDEILLSDATRVATKAQEAGVEVTLEVWEGMQHGWQFAADLVPESQQALDHIKEFIIRYCPS